MSHLTPEHSEKSRAEFEASMCADGWLPSSMKRHAVSGEYVSKDLYWTFVGWLARHETLCVELPEGEWMGQIDPEYGLREQQVHKAITDAGIQYKVKP